MARLRHVVSDLPPDDLLRVAVDYRRQVDEALPGLKGVPRNRLPETVTGIQGIARDTGIEIYTVGRTADVNLHPLIVVDPDVSITEGAPRKPWR